MNRKQLGIRAADFVAETVGSWSFILIQTMCLFAWIVYNLLYHAWDPYPFILLNLALSFQAAFTAPIIMMSQNRTADIDRKKLDRDLQTNLREEQKIMELQDLVQQLLDKLDKK